MYKKVLTNPQNHSKKRMPRTKENLLRQGWEELEAQLGFTHGMEPDLIR